MTTCSVTEKGILEVFSSDLSGQTDLVPDLQLIPAVYLLLTLFEENVRLVK